MLRTIATMGQPECRRETCVRMPDYGPEDAPLWLSSHRSSSVGGALIDTILVARLERAYRRFRTDETIGYLGNVG
jgi:hypothetical protein